MPFAGLGINKKQKTPMVGLISKFLTNHLKSLNETSDVREQLGGGYIKCFEDLYEKGRKGEKEPSCL